MRNLLILCFAVLSFSSFSQELNAKVVVNSKQTGNENLPIFKTLQTQLTEFLNNTKWTNKNFGEQERIVCNFVINVNKYSGDSFEGTLQIQSARPVFGTTYTTPIYNFNDKNFNFKYLEFQSLNFSPTQYESNLVSVLAFHVYMIIGLDADTFAPNGGDVYFKQAQTILNYSQQEDYTGWKAEDGQQTRYMLIDNLLASTYKEYREVLYTYHRKGLDEMSNGIKNGKEEIVSSLQLFGTMNSRKPNSFLLRTFFDAKADEIAQVLSGGPKIDLVKTKELLHKIAPSYMNIWQGIKF